MDFESLYLFQDQVLTMLRKVDTGFYLTGGTAASRGFLHHRYSEDLDFFVNDDSKFTLWADRIVARLSESDDWTTEVSLRDVRYVRVFLKQPSVTLKIDLVNDVPSHIGDVSDHPVLGHIDSAENILANKISALVDREEPKDLADVWGFCSKMDLSIERALGGAQSKAAGIFPADVARVLMSARQEDWEVIRWINAPDPHTFVTDLRRLAESLLLLPNRTQ